MQPRFERHFSPYDLSGGPPQVFFEDGSEDDQLQGPPDYDEQYQPPGGLIDQPEEIQLPVDGGREQILRAAHDVEAGDQETGSRPTDEPVVAGVNLSLLNRLRAEVRHSIDGWAADSTQEEESGNEFEYVLGLAYSENQAESDPHYYAEVEQRNGPGRMLARAHIAEETVRFDLQTVGSNSDAIPGLDEGQFVDWSLDTFQHYLGGAINHADSTLTEGSADYRQFQMMLAEDETNILQAADNMSSAEAFRRNGLDEVTCVCVDASHGQETIYVRFSKPTAEDVNQESRAEEGLPDTTVALERDPVDQEKIEAIVEYLDSPSVRRYVDIPTTKGEPMAYVQSIEQHITDSDLPTYLADLFSDQFEGYYEWPAHSLFPVLVARERVGADIVAGGLETAFARGKTVLDVAGGRAIAAHQLGLRFPEATIIVADRDYAEERQIQPGQPGVQLTRSDWNDLEEVPDNSVDTILSHFGAFLHQKGDSRFLDAVTRVARDGAVLRFQYSDVGLLGYGEMFLQLQKRGWDAVIRHKSVIAVKRGA